MTAIFSVFRCPNAAFTLATAPCKSNNVLPHPGQLINSALYRRTPADCKIFRLNSKGKVRSSISGVSIQRPPARRSRKNRPIVKPPQDGFVLSPSPARQPDNRLDSQAGLLYPAEYFPVKAIFDRQCQNQHRFPILPQPPVKSASSSSDRQICTNLYLLSIVCSPFLYAPTLHNGEAFRL